MNTKQSSKLKAAVALVMRVVERVENGIPVKIAIAGEGATLDVYLEYLREHPKLEALQEAAKRKFLERAVCSMLSEEKAGANYRWLLEHCHPGLLEQPGGAGSTAPLKNMVGTRDDVLNRPCDCADRELGAYYSATRCPAIQAFVCF